MSGSGVFELLDGLIEHTRNANIEWLKTSAPHEYEWNGSSGRIILTSIDGDGLMPILVSIHDANGQAFRSWRVNADSQDDEVEFDERARVLWQLVTSKYDVIAGLIRDLQSPPPF